MYKLSVVKKLFKEAVKSGGLSIGHGHDGSYYIKGDWWVMFYDSANYMPKEILGELIALCGKLPEKGSAFRDYGEEKSQQMEMYDEQLKEQVLPFVRMRYIYTRVQLMGGTPHRIIQGVDTKNLKMIDARTYNLVEGGKGPMSCPESLWVIYEAEGKILAVFDKAQTSNDEVKDFLTWNEEKILV